jgi:ATP-dependent Zn protease
MNRSSRAPESIMAAICLALALLVLAVPAGAASAIHFTHESYTDFQKQLSAGQIHAVTFNKKAHSVHVSLNDGRHVLASYPSHDEPQIAAQLRAKGASVKVKKAKKPAAAHHTLRYIAGGIVVILILVVLVVLLIGRRRTLVQTGGEAGGEQASGGGASGGGAPRQPEETPAAAPPVG